LAVSRAFGDKDFKLRKDGGTIDDIDDATMKVLLFLFFAFLLPSFRPSFLPTCLSASLSLFSFFSFLHTHRTPPPHPPPTPPLPVLTILQRLEESKAQSSASGNDSAIKVGGRGCFGRGEGEGEWGTNPTAGGSGCSGGVVFLFIFVCLGCEAGKLVRQRGVRDHRVPRHRHTRHTCAFEGRTYWCWERE
jgi:hypothetical protein